MAMTKDEDVRRTNRFICSQSKWDTKRCRHAAAYRTRNHASLSNKTREGCVVTNFSIITRKQAQNHAPVSRSNLWRVVDRRFDQHLHRTIVIPAFGHIVRVERLRFAVTVRSQRLYAALDMASNITLD